MALPVKVPGLNTNIICFGVCFHVQTQHCRRGHPTIRTQVFHSDDVIASIDSYAERKLDRETLTGMLTDQHWEIIADLRHGRLSLSKPHPDTVAPPRKRRTAVTIALSRRRPRHSRITILAAVFAVSSWTAASLTFGTELGLAPDLTVVSSKRLQTSEPAPRPIEDPLPEVQLIE